MVKSIIYNTWSDGRDRWSNSLVSALCHYFPSRYWKRRVERQWYLLSSSNKWLVLLVQVRTINVNNTGTFLFRLLHSTRESISIVEIISILCYNLSTSCCFFHDTGTLIPRHSNHQRSSEILCLLKGSLRFAPGISDGVSVRQFISLVTWQALGRLTLNKNWHVRLWLKFLSMFAEIKYTV